jgi:hypothetical protein
VLRVTAPPGTDALLIANTPDFAGARRVPVARAARYSWRLADGAATGSRTVYVRFVGGGDVAPAVSTRVTIDLAPPAVAAAGVVLGPAPAPRSAPAAAVSAARRFLRIRAADVGSGVTRLQLAARRDRPWAWRRYRPRVSVRTAAVRVYVRVADAAGNVSGWRTVRLDPARRRQ